MQKFPGTTIPGNEKGATLVVALIMLVLISLIGVSSLKSASVVERMSANDYQKNITFQASESAAEVALADTAQISQALINGVVQDAQVTTNIANVNATVTYRTAGTADTFGSSLGAQGFSGQRIMVTSTGQMSTDANMVSRTVHGVVRLVPGG